MRQAAHIFKKDFRYLWREVCLVAALAVIFVWAAIFAWKDPWWVDVLLSVAASYLIIRVIHAEAIPGDKQFWITRPYRWKSLLGAKLLFILVFVNLPLFVARCLILITDRFPLAASLPGLLWLQVLLILVVAFPIAALASITSRINGVIVSIMVLVTIWFSVHGIPMLRDTQWPAGVDWVRDFIVGSALVATSLVVLYLQYRNRRTLFSRTIAIGAIALVAAVYCYMPWSLGMALQSRLPKPPFDALSVNVKVDPAPKAFFDIPIKPDQIQMVLRFTVTGVPADVEVQADGLAVTFQGSHGRQWSSNLAGMNERINGSGMTTFNRAITMDSSFFKQERGQPVTLRAGLYLTFFGNARARDILLAEKPVDVMDGLQCYTAVFDEMLCRSAFRWPSLLVYAKIQSNINSLGQFISYSPFPAAIGLNSVVGRLTAGPPPSDRRVTIIVKEPLEHLRRDLEARDVHLTDFLPAGSVIP